MTNNDGSVIEVKGGGTLTLTDSAPGTMHYYSVDPDTKLWTILPDDTGAAGSIQGGIITGGSTGQSGVPIRTGGSLTMNGGTIAGCRVNGQGGGVYVSGGSTFTMNGGSISDSGVSSGRESYNTIYNLGTFIANGGAVTNSGSGLYNYALYTIGILKSEQGSSGTEFFGTARTGVNGNLFDGGIFNGQVLNYDQISGGTFCGTVTNHNGGVIAGGVFESGSTVINNGEITNGTFHGSVTNDGKITGGIFYGTVSGDGTIEDSAKRTVSFDTDGGSDIEAQKILRGQKAVRPTDSIRSGYRFNGWYTDGVYTAEYDFNTPVLDTLTLTAK